jgi:hypothetical protein
MATTPDETGQLTKLLFSAYKDIKFKEKDSEAGEYAVMFNPSSVVVKLQVDREESQANGSTSSEMKFKKIKPQDYTFEFIIDGTGATLSEDEVKKEVPEEVGNFLKVVYHYKEAEHSPGYVMIRYGAVLLKCVLKSVDISYTLFTANAKPLRAKINCSFTSCVDQELSELINSKSSPDLTHRRVIKADEKLISVANKIYKQNNYYIDVSRKNNLDNFRYVPTGTEVYFPPLKK